MSGERTFGVKPDERGKGVKLDFGKQRYDLIPVRAQGEFVKVLTFGAVKYKANNWRKVIGWRWRYIGAALRHIFAFMAGEKMDPESGAHHLAHALCCLYFVLDNELSLLEGLVVPDGDADPDDGKADDLQKTLTEGVKTMEQVKDEVKVVKCEHLNDVRTCMFTVCINNRAKAAGR